MTTQGLYLLGYSSISAFTFMAIFSSYRRYNGLNPDLRLVLFASILWPFTLAAGVCMAAYLFIVGDDEKRSNK